MIITTGPHSEKMRTVLLALSSEKTVSAEPKSPNDLLTGLLSDIESVLDGIGAPYLDEDDEGKAFRLSPAERLRCWIEDRCGGVIRSGVDHTEELKTLAEITRHLASGWGQFATHHGGSCTCHPCIAHREYRALYSKS